MRRSKPIKVALRRHGERPENTKTQELTPNGMANAIIEGRKLSKTSALKSYSSPVSRAKQTAQLINFGFKKSGGQTYKNVRVRKRFGEDLIDTANFDPIKFKEFTNKFKSEYEIYRAWFDGKIPKGIFKPREKAVYDSLKTISLAQYVQKRRRLISKKRELTENEAKSITLDYTGHSGINDAVFETLTGRKIEKLTQFLEPLNFTFYSNGKIALIFRKERFDVTKRFNEILSRK